MTRIRPLPSLAMVLCASALLPAAAHAAEGDDIVLLYTSRLANTLTLDKITDPATVAKARFFITTDGGKSWALAQETVVAPQPGAKPELPRFAFTAPKDGMYGVMTCVTYRDGHAEPEPRAGQAPLYALVVDTIPPVVVRLAATLTSRSAATAVVHCAWSAIDANLADDPVTIEASIDDGAHFTPLFHGPGSGENDLAIPISVKTAMIAVRLTAIDRTHAVTISPNQIVPLSDEAKALVAAATPAAAPVTAPVAAPLAAAPGAAAAPTPVAAPAPPDVSAQAKAQLAKAAAELGGLGTAPGTAQATPAAGTTPAAAPVAPAAQAAPPAPVAAPAATPVAVAAPVPVAPSASPTPATPATAPAAPAAAEPNTVVTSATPPPIAAADPLPAPAATPAPALAPLAALDPAPSPKRPTAAAPAAAPAPTPAPVAAIVRPVPPPAPAAPVTAPQPTVPVIVDGQRTAPEIGAFIGGPEAKQLLDDARTAARLDHIDESCDLYERLLASPYSRPASGEEVKLLVKAGRPRDVVTLVDSLPIELHGDAVRLEHGRCLLALGKTDAAVAALTGVRGGAPESREAFYLIARAYAVKGRTAESRKLLEYLAGGTDAVAAAASADLKR